MFKRVVVFGPQKEIEPERPAMTNRTALRHDPTETRCAKCGEVLSSPEHSFDFAEEGLLIELWSCARCGNSFETETHAAAAPSARSCSDASMEPVLLVA